MWGRSSGYECHTSSWDPAGPLIHTHCSGQVVPCSHTERLSLALLSSSFHFECCTSRSQNLAGFCCHTRCSGQAGSLCHKHCHCLGPVDLWFHRQRKHDLAVVIDCSSTQYCSSHRECCTLNWDPVDPSCHKHCSDQAVLECHRRNPYLAVPSCHKQRQPGRLVPCCRTWSSRSAAGCTKVPEFREAMVVSVLASPDPVVCFPWQFHTGHTSH